MSNTTAPPVKSARMLEANQLITADLEPRHPDAITLSIPLSNAKMAEVRFSIKDAHVEKPYHEPSPLRIPSMDEVIATIGMMDSMTTVAITPPDVPEWYPVESGLPDSDITVMIHHPDADKPVWLGSHDGETWRQVSGDRADVTHWAEMYGPPRNV